MTKTAALIILVLAFALGTSALAQTHSEAYKDNLFSTGELKPVDSVLKVKVGDRAPDFTLPSIAGQMVALGHYRGKKNVVLSFVPAAWTPVCSDQWPGYNIVKDLFDASDAILLGITVDNIPTLYAWTNQMGHLWFPVLSDFYPHGKVAEAYGVWKEKHNYGKTYMGVERTTFIIAKDGAIARIFPKVKVDGHSEEVLAALRG